MAFCILGLAIIFVWLSFNRAHFSPDIRFVISSWPTSQLVKAGDVLNIFEKRGLRVKIIDVGNDFDRAVNLVKNNEADGGIFVLSEPLLMSGSGTPMKVVLGVDYSSGADAIISSGAVNSIQDLRGKRIAYQVGSYGDFLLREALSRENMKLSDVVSVDTVSTDCGRVFLEGNVDAVITFGSYLRQSLEKSGSHVLFSSKDTPGLIPDVIAFRSSFVQDNRDKVTLFLNSWFDVLARLKGTTNERNEILAVVAMAVGDTIENVETSFANLTLYSFADNAVSFTYIDDVVSLYQSGKRFLNFFENTSEFEKTVNLNDLMDPSFIRSGLRK